MTIDFGLRGRTAASKDLLVVGLVVVAGFLASAYLDFFERVAAFDRSAPQWHVDDILVAVAAGCVAVGWFAWRRWREAQHQAAMLRLSLEDLEARSRELVIARDAAEAAHRIRGEFLATMNHELRTPLNAIIGFSDIMAAKLFGPLGAVEYCDYVDDIGLSAKHLLSLVEDILTICRIDGGNVTFRREECDLGAIAAGVKQESAALAIKAGVALQLDAACEPMPITADRTAMRSLAMKLLSNAIKFTPAGGQVVVGARWHSSGGVEFYVSDTGIGMSEVDIESAFQPFRQADNSLARRYDGAGLGLPIARAIAEQHGGRLTVESALGRGTRVSAIFPARAPVETAMDAAGLVSAAA